MTTDNKTLGELALEDFVTYVRQAAAEGRVVATRWTREPELDVRASIHSRYRTHRPGPVVVVSVVMRAKDYVAQDLTVTERTLEAALGRPGSGLDG